MKQWKKYVGYVGYDHWDQSAAGLASTNPGPIDNSILFKSMWFYVCEVLVHGTRAHDTRGGGGKSL